MIFYPRGTFYPGAHVNGIGTHRPYGVAHVIRVKSSGKYNEFAFKFPAGKNVPRKALSRAPVGVRRIGVKKKVVGVV